MKLSLQLPRVLGRFDAAMMIVGNMIGIGIFTTTGFYAANLASPALLLLIWFLGAVLVFCGAVTYAELSTRFPKAGGDYHFLSNAYHPLAGFLFGWSTFLVTYTGSIAAIAIGFAAYFLRLLPGPWQAFSVSLGLFDLTMQQLVALLVSFLLTLLNSRGMQRGSWFQNGFTLLGILTLLGLIVFGALSGNGSIANFQPFWPQQFGLAELSSMGVAMIGVIFTYAGWTVIVYIAGEIREPGHNIPAAMAAAVLLVATLYVLTNAIYLYAQPLAAMGGDIEIGFKTLGILFGETTGRWFSLIIMLMVASSLNATILSGPRIYYAMARDGYFFRWAGELHASYKAPVKGLWIQFAYVALLILTNYFNTLLTRLVFVILLCGLLSGVALVILRRHNPAASGAYSAWGYPWTTLVYILFSLGILLNTLYREPVNSLTGLAIVATGVPFYFWWRARQN